MRIPTLEITQCIPTLYRITWDFICLKVCPSPSPKDYRSEHCHFGVLYPQVCDKHTYCTGTTLVANQWLLLLALCSIDSHFDHYQLSNDHCQPIFSIIRYFGVVNPITSQITMIFSISHCIPWKKGRSLFGSSWIIMGYWKSSYPMIITLW